MRHAHSPQALDYKLAEGLLDVHCTMRRRNHLKAYKDDTIRKIGDELKRHLRNFRYDEIRRRDT